MSDVRVRLVPRGTLPGVDRAALLAAAILLLPAAALIFQAVGLGPAVDVLVWLLVPSAVGMFVALAVRPAVALQVVRAISPGLLAGLGATLAYDSSRAVLAGVGLVSDPFRSIQLYGLALGASADTAAAAGWLLHFWNGAAFGLAFARLAGRPTILKGIAWGLFLEFAQVATAPRLLRLTFEGELLTSSAVGHLAYGITLAALVRARSARVERGWKRWML